MTFVAVGALAAGTLTACSTSGSSTSTTLTIAASSAPLSFDPTKDSNGNTQTFYQELAYEPLIESNGQGKLVPGLATKWGYEAGHEGTRFDLNIRSNAKFADGTKVTTQAVANSLNFFIKNATGPTAVSYAGLSAESISASQVRITSATPNPIIADLMTPYNIGGNIISARGLADPTGLAKASFGAGPYIYQPSQSVAGDHYTYLPNKNYYDQSRIKFSKVVMKVIANNNSALQALRSGQIDLFLGDSTLVSSAQAAKLTIVHAPSSFDGFFILDWKGKIVPALGNVKVRQAINYAIDRKAIAKAVYGDYGSALDQPNTPGWDAYSKSLDSTYPYDVAKAKKLLTDAGYGSGFTMSIMYTAFEPTTTKLIQAVADQLSKVGITVQLKADADFAALGADLGSKQYAGVSLTWGGQTQFVNTNELWQKASALNPLGNEVDGLASAFTSYAASTAADRESSAQAVQKVLVDQAVSVPVALVDTIWIASPKLKGFTLDPTGNANNPADWSIG